jgi:2-haloacid dehalogenase
MENMTSMTRPEIAVFDAYGTLFDVHSAVARLADRMGPDAERISELWRIKQLEYTWTRSLMQRYADFWQVTEEALDYTLAMFGQRDAALRSALLNAYRELDAYPEVHQALAGYRAAGIRVAVFSNATRPMLLAALAAAHLDDLVDALYSVHELRIFKPDVRVYAAAAEALGAAPSAIAFHSSNAWDVAGATSAGWRALWINRARRPGEYPWIPAPAVSGLDLALKHVTATVPIAGTNDRT